MRLTLRSKGQFAKRLQERIDKWAAAKGIAARIHIPPELEWVYWQEYGVPGHKIVPVESKMLAFPGEGGTELRDQVDWPGIKPHHTVTKSLDDIHTNAAVLVQEAMAQGAADDPELLRQAVVNAVEEAKAIIVGGMAADLPGTRPDNPEHPKQSGKLHGDTAANVFDELAEVVEVE